MSVERILGERAALVALLRRPDVRWAEVAHQIQEVGGAAAVLEQALRPADVLFTDETDTAALIEAAATEIRDWQRQGIRVRAFFDDDYPARLHDIREMPPILFTRGSLQPDPRAIAVVGSREASDEGLRIAHAAASSLAHQGVTVVSGLARGIDTVAHQAALEAGGRTVAVVGTGLHHCYPAENQHLQERIAREGLVVSQFWPETGPSRQNFPMRNAVMSGYAAGTVVVEAGWKSGARIQARLALQHGRPVVLTSQVMQHDWAKSFSERPGVYVVSGIAQLLEVVDDILRRAPAADLEAFPDLAAL